MKYREIVGCTVIHDELEKHIPKEWTILKAIEISPGSCEECDPEGCFSYFAILFKDGMDEPHLCEYTYHYSGGVLKEKNALVELPK